jgi:hypothetical protein
MNYIFKAQRFQNFLSIWSKKQYFKAISYLINSMPNITYPLKEKLGEELKERGQPSYDAMLRKAAIKYGHHNDIRNVKNVVWRQVFHVLGAAIAFVVPFFAYKVTHNLTEDLSLSVFFFLSIWLCHMTYHWKKEFIDDPQFDGRFFIKNIVDLVAWHLPGIIFLWSVF